MVKDMTNDRRKTFNTPLEFWQWAIQFPKKRKATAGPGFGSVYLAEDFHNGVSCYGCWPTQSNVKVPLTAVEDEHGVIEEEKPMMPAEAALRAFYGGDKAPHLVDKIVALIDERIAAATVETHCLPTRDALFSIPGTEPAWIPRNNLRLKPKGESK